MFGTIQGGMLNIGRMGSTKQHYTYVLDVQMVVGPIFEKRFTNRINVWGSLLSDTSISFPEFPRHNKPQTITTAGGFCFFPAVAGRSEPKPPADSLGLSIPGSVEEEQLESMDPHKNLPLSTVRRSIATIWGCFVHRGYSNSFHQMAKYHFSDFCNGSSNPQKDRSWQHPVGKSW